MKTALLLQGGYFKRHKRTSILAKWFEYDVCYELPQLNANLRYRYKLSPYVIIMAYGLLNLSLFYGILELNNYMYLSRL